MGVSLPTYDDKVGSVDDLIAPMVQIWRELLVVPIVEITDNFFELGGNSLLATRLAVRLDEALGLPVTLDMLFEHPTIERLLAHWSRLLAAAVE